MNDDDVDRRLRAYASRWRAAQPPPPSPHLSRAGFPVAGKRLATLGTAAAAVLVIGIATLLVADLDQPPGASSVPPEAATPTGSAPSSPPSSAPRQCPPPDARPSILPWIAAGEPIPKPEIYVAPAGPQSDGAGVSWHAPSSTLNDPYSVKLRRYSDPIGSGQETVPVRLMGVLGNFYQGSVPGDAAILWESGKWPCNIVALEMSAQSRMTRPEARQVIIQIAESLRPLSRSAVEDGCPVGEVRPAYPGFPSKSESVLLGCAQLRDGRQVELLNRIQPSGCLQIVGVDNGLRECGNAPSEQDPSQTGKAVTAQMIAQRNESASLEVYGATSPDVTTVELTYTDGASTQTTSAELIRVTDDEVLEQAGIAEPFGYFLAELPPEVSNVNAVALGSGGQRLGEDSFEPYLQSQPRTAPISGPGG